VLLICALAVAANLLTILLFSNLMIPLFWDTLFTVAVAFALGLFPGIAVAVLTWAMNAIFLPYGSFHPFVFVSIAEVFLVCLLKPLAFEEQSWTRNPTIPERKATYVAIVSAQLFVLYIVCAVAASVIGGSIAFLYYMVWDRGIPSFFIAVNAFRWNFLQGGSPVLLADILPRIQINIVGRFMSIFGGYFISLIIKQAVKVFLSKTISPDGTRRVPGP